jgi:hypothetical protein
MARSSDPNLYIVPDGYIELTRALKKTVERLFGAKYVTPFTERSRKAEAVNRNRERRWNAATDLLRRDLQSRKLRAYLRQNGVPNSLDPSHWSEWKPSWRPFAIDPLGKPDAPVYLLRCDDWEQWVSALRSKDTAAASKANTIHTVQPKPSASRARGRPKGTGQYPRDEGLIEKALELLKAGKATSALDAAKKVAGNPNDNRYNAAVERLRKKIRQRRVGI